MLATGLLEIACFGFFVADFYMRLVASGGWPRSAIQRSQLLRIAVMAILIADIAFQFLHNRKYRVLRVVRPLFLMVSTTW